MAKKAVTFKGEAKPFGASGHFNEPRRHELQAKGIRTGRHTNVAMPMPTSGKLNTHEYELKKSLNPNFDNILTIDGKDFNIKKIPFGYKVKYPGYESDLGSTIQADSIEELKPKLNFWLHGEIPQNWSRVYKGWNIETHVGMGIRQTIVGGHASKDNVTTPEHEYIWGKATFLEIEYEIVEDIEKMIKNPMW